METNGDAGVSGAAFLVGTKRSDNSCAFHHVDLINGRAVAGGHGASRLPARAAVRTSAEHPKSLVECC